MRDLRALPKAELHLHLLGANPHVFPHFGPPEQVLELVLEAGWEEGARLGVGFGLTMAAQRHRGPQAAEDLARFAGRYAARGCTPSD